MNKLKQKKKENYLNHSSYRFGVKRVMAFKAKVPTVNLLMLVKTSLALLTLLLTIHGLPDSANNNFSPFLLGSSYKLGVVSYSSQLGSIGWSSPEVRERLDLDSYSELDLDLDSDEDESHRFSSSNGQTRQELNFNRFGHEKLHQHPNQNHHHHDRDHHRPHHDHHQHHHHQRHRHLDENKHHKDLREYSEEQSVENNQRCHDKEAQDSLIATINEEPTERYLVERFLVARRQEEKNNRKEFDTEQSSGPTKRHRRRRRRRRRAQALSSKIASSNGTQLAASGATLRNTTTTSGHKQSMATNKVTPEEIGRQVQLALNEKRSRFKSQSKSLSQPESRFQFQYQSKFKRQSAEQELDLAVNRLHILESLDAQLRQFVDNAVLLAENSTTSSTSSLNSTAANVGEGKGYNPSSETPKQPIGFRFGQGLVGLRPEGVTKNREEEEDDDDDDDDGDDNNGQDEGDEPSDETCVLMLNWAFEVPSTSKMVAGKSKKPNSCLANPQLKRQIPPYMLNLYLQLRAESRSLAEATKLMPYQSVVMRSFRQPKLDEDEDEDDDYYNNSDEREHPRQLEMVEPDRKRNNGEWAGERDDDHGRDDADSDENEDDNEGEREKYSIGELIVESESEGGGEREREKEEEEGVGEAGRKVRRFDGTANHLLTRGSQVENESENGNGNGNENKRTVFGQVKRAGERKGRSAARSNNKSRNLVVVELNALPDGHHFEEKSQTTTKTSLNSEKRLKFGSDKGSDSNGGQQEIKQVASLSPDELPALSSPKITATATTTTTTAAAAPSSSRLSPPSSSSPPPPQPPQTACKLSERSFEVHKRSELCYWFQISEQLRRKINGSLVRTKTSSSTKRERLVEAELHVFKLLPELLQNTRDRGYFGKNSNGVPTTTTQIASQQIPASSNLGAMSSGSLGSRGIRMNSNSTSSSEWKLKSSRRRRGRTKSLNWPSSLMVNGSSLYANQVKENIAEGENIANEAEKGIVNEEGEEIKRTRKRKKVELRTRIESAKQEQKLSQKEKEKEREKQEKHSENKKQNLLRQMSDGYTQVKNPTIVRTPPPLVTYTNNNLLRGQHTNSLYHLKTNLLEVSLYQILPKKSRDFQSDSLDSVSKNTSKGEQQQWEEDRISSQYPLRLLDIRRIDLDSSGWETFYVKRAVEDWISDSSLNLGLVIKAKSMFEEPIKIGLIRFADLYDHKKVSNKVVAMETEAETEVEVDTSNNNNNNNDSGEDKEDNSGAKKQKTQIEMDLDIERQRLQALQDFDSSHQPILVIYTSLSPSEN